MTRNNEAKTFRNQPNNTTNANLEHSDAVDLEFIFQVQNGYKFRYAPSSLLVLKIWIFDIIVDIFGHCAWNNAFRICHTATITAFAFKDNAHSSVESFGCAASACAHTCAYIRESRASQTVRLDMLCVFGLLSTLIRKANDIRAMTGRSVVLVSATVISTTAINSVFWHTNLLL